MVNRAGGKNDAPADQVRWEDILQLDAHQVEAEGWTDPSQDGVLAHLFEAVEDGNVELSRELLQQLPTALIDTIGPEGDTLLHLACLYSHEACVTLLLEHNASIDVRDEDDSTVLHDSAAGGNMNIVRALVDRRANLIHTTDTDGDQPLHNAARGGHTEVVQFLLLEGADPCKKNKLGETPRETAGKDIEPGIMEALTIAEKQWIATQSLSAVPEPSTPPSAAQGKQAREAQPNEEAKDPDRDEEKETVT